ncbi:ABC transporter substrate-binding protein [Parasulfitobacter algicola]|uniref:Substrate-binding domain-containing protein n=1 Tax=Parasulfitobacter algicola TaxID=2614809 RepID=A0ABX2IQD3_9RHOB|nr:substrate-binding domain-containing protein [Sulfitobacter algicola]NSX55068.1 substrate-binding domain-containing protein [Sulfitobacter algicola]
MTVLNITRLGAMCILLSTAAFADGHLDEMTPNDLLPLAQQEGSVTVYSFTSRISKVEAAFEQAYPGIDLQGFDISSTEQIARLKAEAQAGVANADVIYISDTPVVLTELLETGIIAPYVPPRVADRVDEQYKSPLLAQRLSTKVLMYNEEANPNGAPVDSLWDLTRDEWNGRVVMVDPLQRGDYLDLMTEIVLQSDQMAQAYQTEFGQAIDLDGAANAGEKFIMDLFANDVILVRSTDDVNAAVGKLGQDNPPIGFTSYSDRRDNEEEGWALQVANDVAPAPGIIFPAIVALASEPKNPAAARLVIDFLMGDESDTGGPGLAPFYVAGDYVTRTDIVPHPDAVPLDDFNAWRLAPVETAKIRAEVGDLILTLQ